MLFAPIKRDRTRKLANQRIAPDANRSHATGHIRRLVACVTKQRQGCAESWADRAQQRRRLLNRLPLEASAADPLA